MFYFSCLDEEMQGDKVMTIKPLKIPELHDIGVQF